MQNEIQIRDLTSPDIDALVELYDSVWPETAGLKRGKTKWMLSSVGFRGLCAIIDGKIVGARASFHYNIYYGHRQVNSIQYGNSCVHDNFRRLGIFSKMNAAFVERYFANGNDLIFNVSVQASKLAYQKLGWVYIDALSKLTCFANFGRFIWKTKLNYKKLEGNIVYEKAPIPDITDIDKKLLDIREEYFRGSQNIHTYYNEEFLQWRLNSDSNISIFNVSDIGIVLYKIGYKNGLQVISIGEVILYEYNKKNLKRIIRSLKKTFSPDIFEIAITESHPCYPFYRNIGFLTNPLKKYLNLGVKVVSDEMKQICLNPDNWALSTLDIDTF